MQIINSKKGNCATNSVFILNVIKRCFRYVHNMCSEENGRMRTQNEQYDGSFQMFFVLHISVDRS